MSNHHHVVLHIDKNQAKSWKTREILHRWTQLFAGPYLVQRYLAGDLLDKAELVCVSKSMRSDRIIQKGKSGHIFDDTPPIL